jgi:hypothetical protein
MPALHRNGSQYLAQEKILLSILQDIGVTNQFCVEFGAQNGYLDSTTLILRNQGWDCLLIDNQHDNPDIGLHQYTLTAENISDIFAQHDVPATFDYMNVDVDGIDYYLWEALVEYTPRIVEIEYNCHIAPDISVVIPYDADFVIAGRTTNFGASALALQRLGARKGYHLVDMQINTMFFVHESCGYDRHIAITDKFPKPYLSYKADKWQDFDWEWVTID